MGAAGMQGCKAVICMPVTTPEIKIEAVRRLGGHVKLVGETYSETQTFAQVRLCHACCSADAGQCLPAANLDRASAAPGLNRVCNPLGTYKWRLQAYSPSKPQFSKPQFTTRATIL